MCCGEGGRRTASGGLVVFFFCDTRCFMEGRVRVDYRWCSILGGIGVIKV